MERALVAKADGRASENPGKSLNAGTRVASLCHCTGKELQPLTQQKLVLGQAKKSRPKHVFKARVEGESTESLRFQLLINDSRLTTRLASSVSFGVFQSKMPRQFAFLIEETGTLPMEMMLHSLLTRYVLGSEAYDCMYSLLITLCVGL